MAEQQYWGLNIDMDIFMKGLTALLLLLAGWIVIKIVQSLLRRALKKTPIDPALYKFVSHAAGVVLWVLLIGTLLAWLGVPISTFVAVVGVAAAGIALALKDSLANVAGGIIILFSKPFKNGDFVEVANRSGRVDQIDLLFTTLIAPDDKIVYVPNGLLATSVIVNGEPVKAAEKQ